MDTNASDSDYSAVIDFLRAVKTGNIKQIKEFLSSGKFTPAILVPGEYDCDENNQPLWDDEDEYGFTPLILACSKGNLKVIKLLIKAGADIEQDRWNTNGEYFTPIHFAASLEILDYLLNQGADINATDMMGNTLINSVISRNDNTWANFLIDRGADPTIGDAVYKAIEKKNYPILKKIFNSGVDMRIYLLELASQGFTEYVSEILEGQNLYISRALFLAAEYGHGSIVKLLIQNGADVNTKYSEESELERACWNDYEATEVTPLEIAKKKGHAEVVNILIAAEARD